MCRVLFELMAKRGRSTEEAPPSTESLWATFCDMHTQYELANVERLLAAVLESGAEFSLPVFPFTMSPTEERAIQRHVTETLRELLGARDSAGIDVFALCRRLWGGDPLPLVYRVAKDADLGCFRTESDTLVIDSATGPHRFAVTIAFEVVPEGPLLKYIRKYFVHTTDGKESVLYYDRVLVDAFALEKMLPAYAHVFSE